MWEQIRANQRKSFWLIFLMGLILLGIGYFAAETFQPGGGRAGLAIGAVVFFAQLIVYAVAGESVLMAGMDARELSRDESPRLFNIVEEMQLASGLTFMPKIYLVDSDSPNAFAVGRKPETSAIAVTRGLMYRLDRDEVQGVIAHEIGHLKNQDTRFMTLAGVMLGSIIILSDMAMRMFFYGGRGRRRSDSRGESGGGQAQLIFLAVAVLLVVLGPVLARILYFAMSRTREYLADASAAVYTRYPEGLASALLKISDSGLAMNDVNRAVAPMFIVNPLAADGSSDSIFSTHPPLYDRVKVLRGMAGVSFVDYNKSFGALKKGKSIIGSHTLHEGGAVPFRPPSTEGPLESRVQSKAVVHRMYGYTEILCQCGASLKVPSTYNEPTVRCIRCGLANDVPPPSPPVPEVGMETEAPNFPREPVFMDYTRKAVGAWEGFPCKCGTTIQLSPLFSAPMIQCRKCGTQVRVH